MDIRSDLWEDVSLQGMIVVGTPIGSEAFCKSVVRSKLDEMIERSDITQLHPQAAMKLLFNCVAAAPGYLSQVCHPSVTKRSLLLFDRGVWRLHIPARMGGAGLRSWVSIADYAWFCSVADCTTMEDIDFERSRRFMKAECKEAHALAIVALGGATYVNQADYEFIPPEEDDVLQLRLLHSL
jgi:hypothetical protein